MSPAVPLRCLVVDEDVVHRLLLQQMVRTTPGLELVGGLPDAAQVPLLLAEQGADVLLLDVKTLRPPGLEWVCRLSSLSTAGPAVILVGVNVNHAPEAALTVADFLLKPFSYGRFKQAVARVRGC